jgi:transcriptional regulator GlxA family with amidase domain
MDARVSHLVRLIQENIARNITLDEMAAEVNLTTGHLREVFKREIGMSPLKYQKSLRLLEARRHLENSQLSVLEIMALVGITDESHFNRDFKDVYGLAPLKYRRQYLRQVEQRADEAERESRRGGKGK